MTSLDRSQLPPDNSSASTQDLPKYLALREGVFYFKRKMPTDVARSTSAKAQVWKSLNTRDFNEAVKRLDACLSEFDAAVAAARTKGSTLQNFHNPHECWCLGVITDSQNSQFEFQ